MYCIPSTDGNAFAIGDPLVLAGSADSNGVPTVTLATAGFGNLVLGALVSSGGLKYGTDIVDPARLDTIIIPATKTKNYYVMVADDSNILFEIQEDSIGNNLAATDVGSNVDLVSGTNNGYVSGWMLDSSTVNTGATRQLKIMQAIQRQDNAIGQYCKWLVKPNNHQYAAGVAGV